jgi:hypothetical protein
MFRVTTRTCLAKLRPADAQVPAFKPHITILLQEISFFVSYVSIHKIEFSKAVAARSFFIFVTCPSY